MKKQTEKQKRNTNRSLALWWISGAKNMMKNLHDKTESTKVKNLLSAIFSLIKDVEEEIRNTNYESWKA